MIEILHGMIVVIVVVDVVIIVAHMIGIANFPVIARVIVAFHEPVVVIATSHHLFRH